MLCVGKSITFIFTMDNCFIIFITESDICDVIQNVVETTIQNWVGISENCINDRVTTMIKIYSGRCLLVNYNLPITWRLFVCEFVNKQINPYEHFVFEKRCKFSTLTLMTGLLVCDMNC